MMKLVAILSLIFVQQVSAANLTCLVELDGPDYISEVKFSYDVDEEKYFFEEQEANEFIYSSMTFNIEDNQAEVEFTLTSDDDFAAEDSLSLSLGEKKAIRSSYFLDDKEYEYSVKCSFNK